MNNTDKLLRALIDELGFDVEEVVTKHSDKEYDIDYKLTKKVVTITTHTGTETQKVINPES